jgi:hypothetical protein
MHRGGMIQGKEAERAREQREERRGQNQLVIETRKKSEKVAGVFARPKAEEKLADWCATRDKQRLSGKEKSAEGGQEEDVKERGNGQWRKGMGDERAFYREKVWR